MTIKDKIKNYIFVATKKLFDIKPKSVPVNYPDRREFGDYATPVAMGLAKQMSKKPREVAEQLVAELQQNDDFEKIEIAGPGFINLFLSQKGFDNSMRTISTSNDFGKNDALNNKKVLLEYVSVNPTGPMHIGHGRWAAIGDSMARIMRFCGAELTTEFYINDAGNQINMLNDSVEAVKNGKEVPENGYHGDYIKDIAKLDGDPVSNILAMIQKTLGDFRVEFDNYFSEKSLHKSNYVADTLDFLKQSGVTYEKDGALWFKTTDYGDDKDRVLIKEDGAYTYFAVDIAYHRNKILRNFNELINVFGADHHGYVNRLLSAVKVFAEKEKKDVVLKIIIGQLVNIFRNGIAVRMSKRTGDMISLSEVIEEIGVDAARYFLVMRKADTSFDFDLDIAKKQSDDNPVFYIQYAYARISGLLRKAKEQGAEMDTTQTGFIDSPESHELALELIKFPEILAEIGVSLEPHRVPLYLEGLAAAFHRFYHNNRVVSDDKDLSARRLVIVQAVKNVIFTGLALIGVNAPERM